jgi:hypothetical protein
MKPFSRLLLGALYLLSACNGLLAQELPSRPPIHVNTNTTGGYHVPVVGQPSDTTWMVELTYDINTFPSFYINSPYRIDLNNNVVTSHFKMHTITGSISSLLFYFEFGPSLYKQQPYFMNYYAIEKPLEKASTKQWDSIFKNYHSIEESKGVFNEEELVNGIILSQEWFYDVKAQKIFVNIPSVALVIKQYYSEYYNSTLGGYYSTPVGFKFSQRGDESIDFNQTIYKPEIVWSTLFMSPKFWWNDSLYVHNDTVEAIPLKNMLDRTLADWVFDAIKENKTQAYAYNNTSIEPGAKLTKKGLDTILTRWITICDSCSDPIREPLEYDDLAGLKVVQEVYFDDKTFKFESKIIRAALLLKCFDWSGNEIQGGPATPLLWVKFDE